MKNLPIHSLPKHEFPITIKEIQHKNPYDFTREHRHTYFEIFFFNSGGGFQIIDFQNLPIKKHSSYIVFPGQIHLVNRTDEARGLVLQFQEETIIPTAVKMALQKQHFQQNAAICFEENEAKLEELKPLLNLIIKNSTQTQVPNFELNAHLLYSILLLLFGNNKSDTANIQSEEHQIFTQFLQLLEEHIIENRQVSFYANLLAISEKKLAQITKKIRNEKPLQLIHDRLLLEIKRTLLVQKVSLKEIAYDFDFDSPATFSQFVKAKTGKTPTELLEELIRIHR